MLSLVIEFREFTPGPGYSPRPGSSEPGSVSMFASVRGEGGTSELAGGRLRVIDDRGIWVDLCEDGRAVVSKPEFRRLARLAPDAEIGTGVLVCVLQSVTLLR